MLWYLNIVNQVWLLCKIGPHTQSYGSRWVIVLQHLRNTLHHITAERTQSQQLTLKINHRGQCVASYSRSVISCILPEVHSDIYSSSHTGRHLQANNKPAEFKQSLINLLSTTKTFSSSSSTECLMGLWPRERLQGFSWAVTGVAQTQQLHEYKNTAHSYSREQTPGQSVQTCTFTIQCTRKCSFNQKNSTSLFLWPGGISSCCTCCFLWGFTLLEKLRTLWTFRTEMTLLSLTCSQGVFCLAVGPQGTVDFY